MASDLLAHCVVVFRRCGSRRNELTMPIESVRPIARPVAVLSVVPRSPVALMFSVMQVLM